MLKKTTLVLAVAGALIAAGVATAQVKQGKTRPASTSHLMKGAIKPNSDALKKAVESAPADEKAWKALAVNAALLNEPATR
ncbi:MAG TPA: hypothetical protein VK530_03275 [Candidatus Acidoferrum sp.]|nr:hypothetical protein [Candidatus Acidoferrum sp.]